METPRSTADIEADINKNFRQLMDSPQERERGRLVSPLAQLFEQRMNQHLDEYGAALSFTKEVALVLDRGE